MHTHNQTPNPDFTGGTANLRTKILDFREFYSSRSSISGG